MSWGLLSCLLCDDGEDPCLLASFDIGPGESLSTPAATLPEPLGDVVWVEAPHLVLDPVVLVGFSAVVARDYSPEDLCSFKLVEHGSVDSLRTFSVGAIFVGTIRLAVEAEGEGVRVWDYSRIPRGDD